MIKRVYILCPALIFMSMIMLFSCQNDKSKKERNWSYTYREQSKEPYGTKIAFDHLKHIFPNAEINNKIIAFSTLKNIFSKKEAPTLELYVGETFMTSEEEIEAIKDYLVQGNILFISAANIDDNLKDFLKIDSLESAYISIPLIESMSDFSAFYDQKISIIKDSSYNSFNFHGSKLSGAAYLETTDHVKALGKNSEGKINFIMKKYARGKIYFHTAPQCFTNHFLVQNNNIEYYEQCLSQITPEVKTLNWYSFKTRMPKGESPSKLRMIWANPMLRAAFLLALLGLLIYVFINAKRKQAPIPIIKPNTNDSMEFAQTVGMLYFNKGNNADLCFKMAKYFLELLRNRYQLNTSQLDKSLEEKLCIKTGCSEADASAVIYSTKLALQHLLTSNEEVITYYKLTKKFE